MTLGHVTHAARDGIHVLRYFGSVNYTLAPGLQRFLDALVHDTSLSGLVFDLTAAESLDMMGKVDAARAEYERAVRLPATGRSGRWLQPVQDFLPR